MRVFDRKNLISLESLVDPIILSSGRNAEDEAHKPNPVLTKMMNKRKKGFNKKITVNNKNKTDPEMKTLKNKLMFICF